MYNRLTTVNQNPLPKSNMIRLPHPLLAILLAVFTAPVPAAERPPNVILMLIDDMGWTDLSCYGSRFYETPNIDRLASSGMRLTHAYSACTVCSPTRSAVMTGKYPARLHITDWI